jgi:hypothetical protein
MTSTTLITGMVGVEIKPKHLKDNRERRKMRGENEK